MSSPYELPIAQLFALDVIIDSLSVDDRKEVVAIPAVAFRFLSYPIQIVHLVPPEKLPVLQFANESVLLTTLQSSKNLYSFKSGKSCMFDANFNQLRQAFSTNSRLLYIVLLEFFGAPQPSVKAMASLDMVPIFDELMAKAKRFNYQRPCCAEASQHVVPLYSRRQLGVCGEVRIDVRLYFLGPRREDGGDAGFSSFNMDVSMASMESTNFKNVVSTLADDEAAVKPKSRVEIAPTASLLSHQAVVGNTLGDTSKQLVISGRRKHEDYDDDGFDSGEAFVDEDEAIIIHPPTTFRQSPFRSHCLEVANGPRSHCPSPFESHIFPNEMRVGSPTIVLRRQIDKAIQANGPSSPDNYLILNGRRGRSRSRSRSPSRNRSRSKSPRRPHSQMQMCRHGKNCSSAKCKFPWYSQQRQVMPSPHRSFPRPLSREETRRVRRCYYNETCDVPQPVRRSKGSWRRQTPLARVRRGITPSPPPPPEWYLRARSRSKTATARPAASFQRQPPPPSATQHRKRSPSKKKVSNKKIATCSDIGTNTDGTALVYDNKKEVGNTVVGNRTIRIVPGQQQGTVDEVSTLVNQPSDRLEDLVAEAMANFLVKQLQITSVRLSDNNGQQQQQQPSRAEINKPPENQPKNLSTTVPPSRPIISKPSLTRRHTVAQLTPSFSTFTKLEEHHEESGEEDEEISRAMSLQSDKNQKAKEREEDLPTVSALVGSVPDLPQYYERASVESDDSMPARNNNKNKETVVNRRSHSIQSTDYNDDTFESESASGGVPSPEPFQRPPSVGRRYTVDFSALSSTKKDLTPSPALTSTTPSSSNLARPGLARRNTTMEPPSRTPTFVRGEDGKLVRA